MTPDVLAQWREQGGEVLPVRIRAAERETVGEVVRESWSVRARAWRALRVFLGVNMLAALSVLIPILHFFLVPMLVLLSVLLASFTYARRERIRGGRGVCPLCGEIFPLFSGASRWPIHDRCTACGRAVVIFCDDTATRPRASGSP